MSAYIFDGRSFANRIEQTLVPQVQDLIFQGKQPKVFVVLFLEDEGSVLYTRLKTESAMRVGIIYEAHEFSLRESVDSITSQIRQASADPTVTGVMVQKPTRTIWMDRTGKPGSEFQAWWDQLTQAIDPNKDVDCLTKTNLARIRDRQERLPIQSEVLLPATVKACVEILAEAKRVLGISDSLWSQKTALVIGRSDIVGKPLAEVLAHTFSTVVNIGKRELQENSYIGKDFDILICAVGVEQLITADMIKANAIVIDVGSPKNDIDRDSVEKVASFLTPVPGGVGPVTVVSLMKNVVTTMNGVSL